MKLNKLGLGLTLLIAAVVSAPFSAQAQTVNQRLHDQNARTRQGIKSGQMTRREAAKARLTDKSIHAREARDRAFHNGHLTKAEKTRLNKSLNNNSKRIYNEKHNAKVRH